MPSPIPHGVIAQAHLNRKTDYLFRLSINAIILNEKGEVLVVKESGRSEWDMPGGGMDHGENLKQALARELHEEVSMTGDFLYRIIAAEEPAFLERLGLWQMRLVFAVIPENMMFAPGEDGDEVQFINLTRLKNSEHRIERLVYAYAMKAVV